jgi:hypothetical protein
MVRRSHIRKLFETGVNWYLGRDVFFETVEVVLFDKFERSLDVRSESHLSEINGRLPDEGDSLAQCIGHVNGTRIALANR